MSMRSSGSEGALLLGIDTCGPAGSVALARASTGALEILGARELEGRSYSALLTTALASLVAEAGVTLASLAGIVVVNGPGSFTGVRVGLSTAKGLAEGLRLPVVAVSRLAVLAFVAGAGSAALDAHRNEIFLRLEMPGAAPAERLAGAEELALLAPGAERAAVCDAGAARLLASAWPAAELVQVAAPTAADALRFAAKRILSGEAEELALLDGHYLRRSDAEIFGDKTATAEKQAAGA